MSAFPHARAVVIGVTGAGKSTLAEQLARRFQLDLVELDALYWLPNWVGASDEVFRARVEQATRSPRWVVAGNYSRVRPIIWPRAQAVIWLDYSLWIVFWRLTFRTYRRWRQRELLWGTNYDSLGRHFKIWSDDSLWHWLFTTYGRRKREYPQLFALPENAHLTVIRLRSPAQTERWLADME